MPFPIIAAIGTFLATNAVAIAVTAVSMVYQRQRAKAMAKKIDDSRGFELTVDGEPINLPVAYGFTKIAGVRTYHKVLGTVQMRRSTDTADGFVSFEKGGSGNSDEFSKTEIRSSKNETLITQQAVTVAGIDSFVDIEVNGESYNEKKFANLIQAHRKGGVDNATATANGIPATNKFTNVAWINAVFRLNREEVNYQGVPNVTAYIKGQRVWGIQNGDLTATKAFSKNAAYCLMDYLLRPRQLGGVGLGGLTASQWLNDVKPDTSRINLDAFRSAAVICGTIVLSKESVRGRINGVEPVDRSVDTYSELGSVNDDGELVWVRDTEITYIGNKKKTILSFDQLGAAWSVHRQAPPSRNVSLYECNMTVDTGVPFRENIVSLLECMGEAELTFSEGKYKLILDYPLNNTAQENKLAATYDDSYIVNEDIKITYPGAAERYNRVTVKFDNEEQDFVSDSASWPKVGSTEHQIMLAEDNGKESSMEIYLPGCTVDSLAEAKAENMVRRSRIFVGSGLGSYSLNQKLLTMTIDRRGLVLETGDLIKVSSTTAGIQNVVFRVETIRYDDYLNVILTASQFNYTNLAFSSKATNIRDPRQVFHSVVPNVENLQYHAGKRPGATITSNGWVSWNKPEDDEVKGYQISVSEDNITYTKIAQVTNSRYDIPARYDKGEDLYINVRTESDRGTLSSGVNLFVDNLVSVLPVIGASTTSLINSIAVEWTIPNSFIVEYCNIYYSETNSKPSEPSHTTKIDNFLITDASSENKTYIWIDTVGYGGGVGSMSPPLEGIALPELSVDNQAKIDEAVADAQNAQLVAGQIADEVAVSTASAIAAAEQAVVDAEAVLAASNADSDAAIAAANTAKEAAEQVLADTIAAGDLAIAEANSARDNAEDFAAAAEASSLAADTAASNANIAKEAAVVAKNDAAGSASTATQKATLAANSATTAGDSATAASTSADTATTKATEASQSASTATTAKNAAETAKGQAQTSATSAATSATNADDSANSASTSATISADTLIRNLSITDDPTLALGADSYHTLWQSGAEVADPMTESANRFFTDSTDPEIGGKDYVATVSSQYLSTRRRYAIDRTRRYRLTVRVFVADTAEVGRIHIGTSTYRDTGASLGNEYFVKANYTTPAADRGKFVTYSEERPGSDFNADAAFMRPFIILNYQGNNAVLESRVSYVHLEDITDSFNAGQSASAAATSASAASASQTAAGQSATSASASANTASTKAGEASSSATSAATSKNDAAGSANTATTKATQAANSATAAGTSAGAASTSATTATSKANEASQSATTATTAKNAAETAKGLAESSASAAATSEDNAAGSASAASSSASLAASSEGNASNSASAANSSANSASTWAGEAESSASAASTSEIRAKASKDDAFIYRGDAVDARDTAEGHSNTATSQAIIAVGAADRAQIIQGNFDFSQGFLGWSISSDTGIYLVDQGVAGGYMARARGGRNMTYNVQSIALSNIKKYKLKAKIRNHPNSPGNAKTYIGVITRDKDKNIIGNNSGRSYIVASNEQLVPGVWVELDSEVFSPLDLEPGTAFIDLYLLLNYTQDDTYYTDLAYYGIEEVTTSEELRASVKTNATAIDDVNGKLTASYGIKVGAGGAASLLELVALDDPDGPTTSIARLAADNIILDGTVSTEKLIVGTGRNLIKNSDFQLGETGWIANITGSNQTAGLRTEGTYTSPSTPVWWVRQNDSNTASTIDVRTVAVDKSGSISYNSIGVEGNSWYDFSARIACFNCNVTLLVNWYTGDNTYITSSGSTFNAPSGSSTSGASNFSLQRVLVKAPSNAGGCSVIIRKNGTNNGSAASTVIFAEPNFCLSHESATVSPPYSAGGTTLIDGASIITGSITAASGAIGDLAVDTLQIAGNAVTNKVYAKGSGGLTNINVGNTLSNIVVGNISSTPGYNTEINLSINYVTTSGNYSSGDGFEVSVIIRKNGGSFYSRNVTIHPNVSAYPISLTIFDEASNSGNTSYRVDLKNSAANAASITTSNNLTFLTLGQFKR